MPNDAASDDEAESADNENGCVEIEDPECMEEEAGKSAAVAANSK